MKDYPSNSYKSRENLENKPKEKIEPIVSNVKRKKAGIKSFLADDINNIKDYVFIDVLVPAIKKAVSDVVRNSIDMLSDVVRNGVDMRLYGETRKYNDRDRVKASYRSYYEDRYKDDRERSPRTSRSAYSYDEISIPSRGEAEHVLTRLDELVQTYGVVSVADFYDLVGVEGTYTDNKYGWLDIRSASVRAVHDGYRIILPKAVPLN